MRIKEAKCSTCAWMRGHGDGNRVEFLTCQFNAPRDNGAITAFALVTENDGEGTS